MDDDATLLKNILSLEQKALIDVFDQFAPRLFKYALRICRDPVEADDIVGEVFRKLLEALKSGRGPRNNLRSYLYQMTYHEIVNSARARKHVAGLPEELPIESSEQPSEKQASTQERLDLIKAIDNDLNEDQRHVIHLRFFEELGIEETARILGKTAGNIKVIQNRAVEKLRRVLERETGMTL